VSSNLESEPIEYGGDGYKTQISLSKFFIPGEHSFVILDATKEVFNHMA
jgi:hypothetical protein